MDDARLLKLNYISLFLTKTIVCPVFQILFSYTTLSLIIQHSYSIVGMTHHSFNYSNNFFQTLNLLNSHSLHLFYIFKLGPQNLIEILVAQLTNCSYYCWLFSQALHPAPTLHCHQNNPHIILLFGMLHGSLLDRRQSISTSLHVTYSSNLCRLMPYITLTLILYSHTELYIVSIAHSVVLFSHVL